MLRSLNRSGRPKAEKELSEDERNYIARATERDETLQINAALQRKQREDARKALGI